jgi:hypothetical protein
MQSLQLGDEYQGGIIFFINETNTHGLIASKKDLSGEADWDEAIQFCKDYRQDNFADWRLPTDIELNLLFEQKELVGNFVRFSYWSSTEYAQHFAFFQNFYTGEQDNDFKDNTCYVRAVREYSLLLKVKS